MKCEFSDAELIAIIGSAVAVPATLKAHGSERTEPMLAVSWSWSRMGNIGRRNSRLMPPISLRDLATEIVAGLCMATRRCPMS
jgi:hypothetical protein